MCHRTLFIHLILVLYTVNFLSFRPSEARAGNFRFRAREHFEWLSVRYGHRNETAGYFGLTNTLNAWYEEPFRYAFGLAFGPMLGSAKAQGAIPSGTDSKIRLWNIGLEAKYFFVPGKPGLFGRIGAGGNILDTRGATGKLAGAGYYLGLGWELKIKRLGIAPELAFRHVLLEQGSYILSFTPSIGFHFYVLPKDPKE